MLLSAAVLGLLAWYLECRTWYFCCSLPDCWGGLVDPRTRTKSACRTKTGKKAENNAVVEATWNDVQLEDSREWKWVIA